MKAPSVIASYQCGFAGAAASGAGVAAAAGGGAAASAEGGAGGDAVGGGGTGAGAGVVVCAMAVAELAPTTTTMAMQEHLECAHWVSSDGWWQRALGTRPPCCAPGGHSEDTSRPRRSRAQRFWRRKCASRGARWTPASRESAERLAAVSRDDRRAVRGEGEVSWHAGRREAATRGAAGGGVIDAPSSGHRRAKERGGAVDRRHACVPRLRLRRCDCDCDCVRDCERDHVRLRATASSPSALNIPSIARASPATLVFCPGPRFR